MPYGELKVLTVKELIEALQKMPPDLPVHAADGEYGFVYIKQVLHLSPAEAEEYYGDATECVCLS